MQKSDIQESLENILAKKYIQKPTAQYVELLPNGYKFTQYGRQFKIVAIEVKPRKKK